jgi:hypothetical protein
MSSLHKVLVVACEDASQEAAYEVISVLHEHGYGIDVCHSMEPDASRIKATQALDAESGPSGYDAIVFLDDGGDLEAAVSLAKKASKQDLVIGGLGSGGTVLGEAGILDGEYVSHGHEHGDANTVDAPSVRSGNVVTAIGGCATGFAILLIDALGGKIKKVIRSASGTSNAMVIAPIATWSDYWPIARRMSEMGMLLSLAPWEELDVKSGKTRLAAIFGDADIKLVDDHVIPETVWVADGFCSVCDMVEAIEALEAIGRKNINSSEAIRKSSDAASRAAICAIAGGPAASLMSAKEAARKMLGNSYEAMPAAGARIACSGRGAYALVSRDGTRIGDQAAIAKILSLAANREDILVRESTPDLRIGNLHLDIRCVMSRTAGGWKASTIRLIGDGVSEDATVLRMILPDANFTSEQIEQMAKAIVLLFQSMLEDHDGLAQAMVSFGLKEGRLVPRDFSAVVPFGYLSRSDRQRLAQAMSMQGLDAPKLAQADGHAADMASMLSSRDIGMHRRLLERELAHEGIWLQPDDSVIVAGEDGTDKVPDLESLLDALRRKAIGAARAEHGATRFMAETAKNRLSLVARRARHRYVLVKELVKSMSAPPIRSASLYPSGVAGPFSHLELPMHERVFEWREGDDYLTDKDEYISNLPRYNPEYEKTNFVEPAGFYYTWDEPRRTPTDWIRILEGDTVYPSRTILQRD